MICKNCGKELEGQHKFCTECGAPIGESQTVEASAMAFVSEETYAEDDVESEKKKPNKKNIIIASTAVVALIAVALFAYFNFFSDAAKYDKYLELGQKYLLEENYEQAIVAFEKAIEIEPKSIDARLGISDAYIGMEKYVEAMEWLNEILEIDNINAEAYVRKVNVYILTDDIENANRTIRKMDQLEIQLSEDYNSAIPRKPKIEVIETESVTKVSITGDKDAEIYYTLDGSEPSISSAKYESVLDTLDGNITLKTIAVNQKGLTSPIAEMKLELNNIAYIQSKAYLELLLDLEKQYGILCDTNMPNIALALGDFENNYMNSIEKIFYTTLADMTGDGKKELIVGISRYGYDASGTMFQLQNANFLIYEIDEYGKVKLIDNYDVYGEDGGVFRKTEGGYVKYLINYNGKICFAYEGDEYWAPTDENNQHEFYIISGIMDGRLEKMKVLGRWYCDTADVVEEYYDENNASISEITFNKEKKKYLKLIKVENILRAETWIKDGHKDSKYRDNFTKLINQLKN